ncbi:rhomboid family intramembrane serine protease [Luteolibacter arcticus]|uniref:Rhomboid family intramembrane serine protease n=1 Tax=Luteolibacter arcticus TaxID=1581411 RepID=A0ABT3GIZ6_9BACT|nr:rhomboid family intramembrane serine protease [Luteolibacter arcticus]MCW1923456.1 rhomboid family intramembrane serine protease [Luteolibacter arcticus]
MHSPFVPGRSQRLKWWWEDIRSARFSLALAGVVLAIEAALTLLGGANAIPEVYQALGLSRDGIRKGWVWQIGSHALIHGVWWHALLNVLILITTGARVERIDGWKTAARVFVIGSLVGGVAFLLMPMPMSDMVLVGASGGIFALFLWMTTMSPQSRMVLVPISAKNLGLGVLIASGALAVAVPWLPAGDLVVSHSCHFGGALTGWLIARRNTREPLTLADLQKARARRESAPDS